MLNDIKKILRSVRFGLKGLHNAYRGETQGDKLGAYFIPIVMTALFICRCARGNSNQV